MLKKNNRTKNPTLLVSAQFADSKPKRKKNKKNKRKICSKIYTEFIFFSLLLGNEDGSFFSILKLSIYTVKRIWAESLKWSRWKSKEKAQLTVLCRDLKLMSRHGFVLIAHDQSRPLSFKLQPVFLENALISGRDIEVMSRRHLFSVPSVLMSGPQSHVATSFSFILPPSELRHQF